MIDLLAMKRYEETYIAHLPPGDPTRAWWNGLSFAERCAISSGRQATEDLIKDRQLAEDNA